MHKRETLIEIQIQTFQTATTPCPEHPESLMQSRKKKRKSKKEEKIHIN
jgi:hypothetical protein